MRDILRSSLRAGAVVGLVAYVVAFCYLTLLFWLLFLEWFIIWPGNLETGQQKALVAVGGPAVYFASHFMVYAYIKLWAQSDKVEWGQYGLTLVRAGIGTYLVTHLIAVGMIAFGPGRFLRVFGEHFHGEIALGSDLGFNLFFVAYILGTIAVLTMYFGSEPGKSVV